MISGITKILGTTDMISEIIMILGPSSSCDILLFFVFSFILHSYCAREFFLWLRKAYSLDDPALFQFLLCMALEFFILLLYAHSLLDRPLLQLVIDKLLTKTCTAATLHEKAHATNVRGVENGPGKKKALGVNPKTMMERLGTFWDPDDQREALDTDEMVNLFVEDEPSLEKQKGKLELGATRIAKANVCLSGYKTTRNRELIKQIQGLPRPIHAPPPLPTGADQAKFRWGVQPSTPVPSLPSKNLAFHVQPSTPIYHYTTFPSKPHGGQQSHMSNHAPSFLHYDYTWSNNSKDRLLPRESRMESENGDVEANAFKDYALVDENKKPDTRILYVDGAIGGLKPTVVVANKLDGNMKDGKEGKLEDVKSNQGPDEGLVKKSSRKNSSNKGSMSRPKEWQRLKISLKEIEVATKNFQDCIGKGGYGLVYKGKLYKSGRSVLVAIKRLNTQFGQGLKEFLTEIHLLSGIKHPNLISLLGYCEEGKEKILVYEYAQRGSLDQYLRRNNTTNYTLTWLQRLKICVAVARGLDHIHYHVGKHLTIIHRDLKSANILLDQNLVAKISDFGLSKLSFAGLDNSTVISNVCGTPGYCEPEYMITGMVKKESDVYSFGMVLFDVLCGRLCTVKDNDDILLSGPLIREFYDKKRLEEIIDPSLKEHFNSDSMNKFSEIAYRCLHSDRRQRPPMDVVLKELEDLLKPEV